MSFPGGKRGIAKLVEEHYVALYRYAYRLSGSTAEAEDLTQDAFCQAHEKFYQLRDTDRAKSWLFSILRNAYLHRLRANKHAQAISLDWIEDVAEPMTDSVLEVDTEQLQDALNDLPEVYKTPVILYYFEEFSYRDIAEQMDMPIGTVMSRLARAKAFLRNRLAPQTTGVAADQNRRANDGL